MFPRRHMYSLKCCHFGIQLLPFMFKISQGYQSPPSYLINNLKTKHFNVSSPNLSNTFIEERKDCSDFQSQRSRSSTNRCKRLGGDALVCVFLVLHLYSNILLSRCNALQRG